MKTLMNLKEVKILTKDQQRKLGGGDATGYCGVKIDGQWRRLNDTDGNGTTIEQAQWYVNNGYASGWCCDSCSWNEGSGGPRPPQIFVT
jgi:hypothetical protein